MTYYEKTRNEMYKAIEEGAHITFLKMTMKVNNIIFFEGRFLTEDEQQSLKAEYMHYLGNVMLQRDVEFVYEDCYGNLYKSFSDIPSCVFYRFGLRWIRTKKMLFTMSWTMFIEGEMITLEPSEISLDFLPPEPLEAKTRRYMKQEFYLLNE